ncbi:putative RNA-directed DNA polymerase [Rosa chinensis]|uniref:Putative RNA-directed DNA polymerase n=1 Tax=Rosa chinensis TaxID=74649 RepID=A0A2P6R6N1_ROSCH|nr:putative RNA-directed DNA polymerase [Rosa chinensis]
MVIGDFNAVLGAHEKSGGPSPSRLSCADFQSMSDTCDFVHLDTSGLFFTWSNGWSTSGHVELRLDRCLCDTTWFEAWPFTSCVALPRVVSDHSPLIFSASKLSPSGPKPFRFQSMWLQHPNFHAVVSNCWNSFQLCGCPMFVTLQKLKALKHCLRDWNKAVFGNVHQKVVAARENLVNIQHDIATRGMTDQRFEDEIVAKSAVLDALRMQETYWKDRARVKWLTDGDRSTSFFHTYAKVRAAKSQMSSIRVGERILTDPSDIAAHTVAFYQNLYDIPSPSTNVEEVCSVIPSLVTDDENVVLSAIPTSEEIRSAVFSMDGSSAPGPDGFSGSFYQACWDIVGSDVVACVRQFFLQNWILPNMNCNFLVLIPKVPNAQLITQFRPIALANFLFKIIPKILASRLGSIATRIISPQQSAFLPGRRINHCIGMVSECFNLLDRKAYGGNVGIKVDIAKAFDTLNWDFLLRVLSNFGFSPTFTSWVSSILHSARLSLLINGSPQGFFTCSRGVRQGDPLSPLLFCLAEEALSRGLHLLLQTRQLKPISFPRNCTAPSHVLYADDLMVFCRGDKNSLKRLRGFFDRYSAASGQFINAEKSTFYLGARSGHRTGTVQRILGFHAGRLPLIYLGVPIFCGKPRSCHLQVIADRAKSKLMGWQGRLLSMAGRTQLVQSVFQSMLLHSFSVYQWPAYLVKKLSTWARNFIWSGNIETRKIVTVTWTQVCAPKKEGGVGIRDLATLNSAAVLRFAWNSFTSLNQWGDYMRTRYPILSSSKVRYRKSSIWPGFRSIALHITHNCRWIIGDGRSVSFWKDKWLQDPILDMLGFFDWSGFSDLRVADFISDHSWQFPSFFLDTFPDLYRKISDICLPLDTEPDMLIWETTASGELSFTDSYNLLRRHFIVRDWASTIWHSFIPPRFSFLAWRILLDRLPTDDRLKRGGIPIVSICQLCNSSAESALHLFLHCPFSQHLWGWLATQFGTSFPAYDSLLDFWVGFCQKGFSPQLYNLWLAAGLLTFMEIWKARNRLRFDNRSPIFSTLCCSIMAWIRQFGSLVPGYYKGVLDSRLLSSLGVCPKPRKAPKIQRVLWHPPLPPWVKVNTDGLAKGNPGPAACGGVFRDASGVYLGSFCQPLGCNSSFYAELYAVIVSIEVAFTRGWTTLWLESDSISVLASLSSNSFSPPWDLRVRWQNCLKNIQQMQFRRTHIFREGNAAADKMANLGVSKHSFTWYPSPPAELHRYLQADFLGLPNYRFTGC